MITGGAGFAGSSLIRFLVNETDNQVLNRDKFTYASNLESSNTNFRQDNKWIG